MAKKSGPAGETPMVSIVIPVFNEEALVYASVAELIEKLREFSFPYEILLSENGSKDRTREIGFELERRFPQVRLISSPEPNYGKALRRGILEARGQYVVCDEIDICDTRFYRRSLEALFYDQCDLVIGSKLHAEAMDKRPLMRHAASLVITGMLRALLGFKGTDTHGLKAFHRERILPVVQACLVDKDLFASELVIRAERGELRILEIPIEIVEKRTPSIHLWRRVPNVLRNMAKLVWAIRIKG
ncbi:MAG: glycosyltransferase [Deltaproteobacteria bacterium]|nr:glycosyltransferase [Deltaproteobacteria bacterium]